jgi:hypothetical protein
VQFQLKHLIILVTWYALIFTAITIDIEISVWMHQYLMIAVGAALATYTQRKQSIRRIVWSATLGAIIGGILNEVLWLAAWETRFTGLNLAKYLSRRGPGAGDPSSILEFCLRVITGLPLAVVTGFALGNIIYCEYLLPDRIRRVFHKSAMASLGLLVAIVTMLFVLVADGDYWIQFDVATVFLVFSALLALFLTTWIPQMWQLVDRRREKYPTK